MESQKQQNQFSSVSMKRVLSKIFINAFWVGILLIVFSLWIQQCFSPTRSYWIVILKLFENAGIAIVIATIFTFVIGTTEFIEFINKKLENIIVSNSFLANISPKHKKKAIQLIIQPTENEINKYPNIVDYYGSLSTKMINISKHGIRSNYYITCKAFFDKEKQKICVNGIYNYRLYPSINGFEDIKVGYLTHENDNSSCGYIRIANNQGEIYPKKINNESLGFREEEIIKENNTFCVKTEKLDISKEQEHLDIEICAIEYGDGKSMLYTFMALQDTHGFKLRLECEHNVKIREFCTFVIDAQKFEDFDKENPTVIQISCNQWISKGSGLSILLNINDSEKNSDSTSNVNLA